ncbi:hypothetical protein CTAYLR_007290 [Chrysophaeum taylorii]|uniref:ABC transporter domain-containing protein n=1 Tax=Chrysophaeum taylorii TaxID=2483200 RepID=A0AAD7XRV4_9STRA|nr:hypothetical protein CTAYLR_007290 [Chrysophaeum taylorii]
MMVSKKKKQALREESRFSPTYLQCFDLSYRVRVGAERVLRDINVTFEPDKATAVVGPSSSNASLFLHVVLGRCSGLRTGDVLVNGAARSVVELGKLVALMPRDATLFSELTVKQSIYYAAMLRSPSTFNKLARFARADVVIERFGLARVQHQRIGDDKNPGLSTGQRKRVLASIECLSLRPIFFASEPTDGLDSAGAKAVVDACVVASTMQGQTVVVTLQQPSSALLGAFHRVLLLAPGGAVVFHGPPDTLWGYLSQWTTPSSSLSSNVADFALEVLWKEEPGSSWEERWLASDERAKALCRQERVIATLMDEDAKPRKKGMIATTITTENKVFKPLSGWARYRMLLLRSTHVWIANNSLGLLSYKVFVAASLLTSLGVIAVSRSPSRFKDVARFYAIVTFYVAITPATLATPSELKVVKAELGGGAYSFKPYWLAKVTLLLLHAVLLALLSMGMFYVVFGKNVTSVRSLEGFAALVLHFATSTMMGTCIGAVVPIAVGMQLVAFLVVVGLITTTGRPPRASFESRTQQYPDVASSWVLEVIEDIRRRRGRDALAAAWLSSTDNSERNGNDDSFFFGLSFALQVAQLVGTHYGAEKRSDLVEITTHDLSFWHASTASEPGNAALRSLSVTFNVATTNVLVGPSGSGATTLLSVLGGSAAGTLQGSVRVNGTPVDQRRLRLVASFTPQDARLVSDLTVHELLSYRAWLQCPRHWSPAQRAARVVEVMEMLPGVDEVGTCRVGSLDHATIAPSLRRLVSLGMDMFADRPVVLVDSPTLGLDAGEALAVLEVIVASSRAERRTLVCSLCQPSGAMMRRFDRLVAMARGRVAYSGSPDLLPAFFERCGTPFPLKEDTGAGAVDYATHILDATDYSSDMWANKWELFLRIDSHTSKQQLPSTNLCALEEARFSSFEKLTATGPEQYAFLTVHVLDLFVRSAEFGAVLCSCVAATILTGIAFDDHTTAARSLRFGSVLASLIPTFSVFGVAITATVTCRQVATRELCGGVCSLGALWLAFSTVITIIAISLALLTTLLWWSMLDLPLDLWRVCWTALSSGLCAASCAMLVAIIGVCSSTELAAAQATVLVWALVVLESVLIVLDKPRSHLGWIVYAVPSTYSSSNVLFCSFKSRLKNSRKRVLEDDDLLLRSFTLRQNAAILCCFLVAAATLGYACAQRAFNTRCREETKPAA